MAAEDLTRAAHAAVLGVRVLRERLGDAREGCDESATRVGALTGTLESDRKALHHAVQELDHAVEEASRRFAEDTAAAEAGLVDLASLCTDAGAEAHQALETEATALDELAGHLREIAPQVASLAESAEAASRAALQRAESIAAELAELVEEAERLLTEELAPALENMAHEVEEMVEPVRKLLDLNAPGILLAKEEEFGARTSEAEDLTNRQFADMEKHSEEVADHSVTRLAAMVDQEMEALEDEARTLEGELENLTGLASDKRAALERSGEAVVSAMGSNAESAKTVEQALEEVRGRWVPFGFAG